MSELKVTDRRWWARGEEGPIASEEPKLKPAYVEELEQKIAVKDLEIQQLVARYKSASDEFEQARARLRKEVTKDVERGRRSLIAGFLDVLDNLDRALDAAGDRATRSSRRLHGATAAVSVDARRTRRPSDLPLGRHFDPARHEAVRALPPTTPLRPAPLSASFARDTLSAMKCSGRLKSRSRQVTTVNDGLARHSAKARRRVTTGPAR